MSTTDSTGLYTAMLDEAEPIQPATTGDSQPHPNWRWFWLGLFLAVAPLLVPYFIGMWGKPTYRYFPFAIAAVVWLTYLRFDGYFYPPRGWFSWGAIGFALLLTAFGTVVQFPWFAAVAFAILCATMLYAMRGPEDSTLLVLVLPLLTIVQLIRADTLLVLWLQNVTTWMSSVLLDTLAVPHAVTNNVIQLADRELFVAEACSGIQSVFTLSFLAFLMIAWRQRRRRFTWRSHACWPFSPTSFGSRSSPWSPIPFSLISPRVGPTNCWVISLWRSLSGSCFPSTT